MVAGHLHDYRTAASQVNLAGPALIIDQIAALRWLILPFSLNHLSPASSASGANSYLYAIFEEFPA